MSSHSVYLDKLVTEPHVPKMKGQIGFYSTTNIPDLSHTGIESTFQPYGMTAYDQKKMSIRKSYREATNDRIKVLHREMIAANAIEKTFCKGHRQFIDRLLVEMEGDKRKKLNKTQKSWKSEKNAVGFGETEFKFFADSSTPAATSSARSENNENNDRLEDSLAYSAEGWGDEDFLNEPNSSENKAEDGNDDKPLQSDSLQDYGEKIDPNYYASTNEFPDKPSSSSSSSIRSSCHSRSSQRSNTSRQSRLTEPSKVRVFNRMSMFTALLNETPVPHSTLGERFGLAKSPTR